MNALKDAKALILLAIHSLIFSTLFFVLGVWTAWTTLNNSLALWFWSSSSMRAPTRVRPTYLFPCKVPGKFDWLSQPMVTAFFKAADCKFLSLLLDSGVYSRKQAVPAYAFLPQDGINLLIYLQVVPQFLMPCLHTYVCK